MTHDDIKARTREAIEHARQMALPNVTIPEHPAVSLVEDGALVEALVWTPTNPQVACQGCKGMTTAGTQLCETCQKRTTVARSSSLAQFLPEPYRTAAPAVPSTLDEYRAKAEQDGNLFWRLSSGDHQNLLEEAIERLDAKPAVPRCKTCRFFDREASDCSHMAVAIPADGSGYCHLHPDAEGR